MKNYHSWLAGKMWKDGNHLFTDGTEQEVKRVAFQMSRIREVFLFKAKYGSDCIHLLYVSDLVLPIVPSSYWYNIIDETDGEYIRMTDVKSVFLTSRDINGNKVGYYEVTE